MRCPNRQVLPKIEVFYRPEWTKRGDHIKINFDYFQIKKWMLQTVRAEKLDKKIVVIGLISMFPTWVMVCKLSKKVHFLQFCADLSEKSKSVEAIYIYASESSHYTLSENAVIYRSLSHCSWDISDYNIKKRCWISRNSSKILRLQTLIPLKQ